jgi:lysophospholipase L1-like esterase
MTEGTTSPPLSTFWRLALNAGLPASYPFKLQLLCSARYTDQTVQVFNGGLAGRRASDDRERFNDALSEGRPEVVLLMEGANDMNSFVSITRTVSAMEDMVRDAQARGAAVMLATIPLQRPGGFRAYNPEAIPEYNEALRVMASKKDALLIDIAAQFPMTLLGQDGLHPTEAGYQRIAEIWFDALKARYELIPETARLASPRATVDSHAVGLAHHVQALPRPKRG